MPDGVRSLSDVFGGDAGGHGGVASVVLDVRITAPVFAVVWLLVHVLWSLAFSTYWGHWLSIPLHARIQDKCYSNCAWAKLSGLPAREIGRCEHTLGDTVSGSAKRPLPPPPPPALPPSADRPILLTPGLSYSPSSSGSLSGARTIQMSSFMDDSMAPAAHATVQDFLASKSLDAAWPVSALTSGNRDNWTDACAALIAASPTNARSLEVIESAIIVVCLDDTKPVTHEAISTAVWLGDGRNRFYDKHHNHIRGSSGSTRAMDGTPTLRMNGFMLATLALGKADPGTPSGETLTAPTELPFELNVTTCALIAGAEARFDTLVGEHELHVLQYEGYGKNAIKQFKASPDTWVQLVKQLVFHKMFGRPGVTYESAQTLAHRAPPATCSRVRW
ncbi:Choline/Carnitine o-acyltransferase-domain-containing protein [Mycena rebaudengoi]|nr:Choline/Carnitine o-acyltransferase-domain-containing protein [Mycena rebaudengoi]